MIGTADKVNRWLIQQEGDPDTMGRVYQIKEYKPKELRKQTQNSLYWEFVGRLADKLIISKAELHNRMLWAYGQKWFSPDGELIQVILPDTEEIFRRVVGDSVTHLMPTSKIVLDGGVLKRVYWLMRGSSTYTSKEMSILIDGLMQECNQQDIDTTRLQDRQYVEEAQRAQKHHPRP